MPDLDTFEADWDTEMEADSAPLFPNSVSLTGADTGVKRHWSQPGPGIIYPKSATFPRQSQKVDDNMVTSVITSQTGSSLYYPGKIHTRFLKIFYFRLFSESRKHYAPH